MPVDAIAALPVGELAAGDAHLFLWAPDRFLNGSRAAAAAAPLWLDLTDQSAG